MRHSCRCVGVRAMAEEGKKISFGFSKTIKKTAVKNVPPPEEKKVDYIECLDEKAIKIIGGEEKKDEPLVIPMLGSKTWHERIVNKVNADIYEPKAVEPTIKNEPTDAIVIKQEKIDDIPNGDATRENVEQPMEVTEIKQEPDAEPQQQLTLEEQAAREILADLNSGEGNEKDQKLFTVPVTGSEDLEGKEESTLEDYENIPIDAFGMAMLRGMGWEPGKGIGKNEKVVPPAIPELRPKGMGLGADKLAVQKLKRKPTKEEQQLKLVKGAFVKIMAGKQSGNYGKVEGFDEDAARIIIKLALGGETITMNEFWVEPVTPAEYSQNSKVLNVKKYEEYKKNEVVDDDKPKSNDDKPKSNLPKTVSDSDEDEKKRKSDRSKKKSKKRKSHSSDDSSVERKSRKRRDSSKSSDDDRHKRSKKSKKHKSRDSSSERSSRKSRKKDKEREKTKHKKSDYSDPSERARNKNRRRSRSRSYSPRDRRRARSRSYSPRR